MNLLLKLHGLLAVLRAMSAALCVLVLSYGCGHRPGQLPIDATLLARNLGQQPGDTGRPKRIAYVVDSSGSMQEDWLGMIGELKRAINGLAEDQEFYLVFFSVRPCEAPPGRPVPATSAAKSAALAFIDTVKPGGNTFAAEALKLAFRSKPDAIVFIGDAGYPGSIIEQIDRLNRGRAVTIDTVCLFAYDGDEPLREIARRNHGTFKWIGGP